MIALLIPSFPDETSAMDWLDKQGTIVRVVLLRGPDGFVRGTALVRPRS